jgi:hypothetical protein
MFANFRARLKRLEKIAAAQAPAGGPPPDFWSWVAHEPLDAATVEECRAWWLAQLPADRTPYRERTEQRIEAALNGWLANERPPLPIGLRELPPEGG